MKLILLLPKKWMLLFLLSAVSSLLYFLWGKSVKSFDSQKAWVKHASCIGYLPSNSWKKVTFSIIMMMMMNFFCGMVDRRNMFSLISSRDHCQRSSPLRISNTPQSEIEPAQNLSSHLVEESCAVVTTSKSRRHINKKRMSPLWQGR